MINKLYRDNLTHEIYKVISHAKLIPKYEKVTICRPIDGGDDLVILDSRFKHLFTEHL